MTKPINNDRPRPDKHDQLEMITNELRLMNKRREWLADTYLPGKPDEVIGSDEELSPEQTFGIVAITAIEEEWIIDPELREELSIITYTEEEEDS